VGGWEQWQGADRLVQGAEAGVVRWLTKSHRKDPSAMVGRRDIASKLPNGWSDTADGTGNSVVQPGCLESHGRIATESLAIRMRIRSNVQC
jgi:hypothetical protein